MEFADRAPASVSARLERRSCRLADCSRQGQDPVASSRAPPLPKQSGPSTAVEICISLFVQEQLEMLSNFRVVFNDQDRSSARRRLRGCVVRAARERSSGAEGSPLGVERDLDREYRPLSVQRAHPDRMAEQFAQAFDDREPQAQTLAPLAGGVVHLMVFFEDRLQLRLRGCRSRCPRSRCAICPGAGGTRRAPCRDGYISARSRSDCGSFARADADRSELTVRRGPCAARGRPPARDKSILPSGGRTAHSRGQSAISGLTAPTSIWLMSSSVFSIPVMAPKASSMPPTSFWAFSPTTFLANKP